MPHFAGAQPGGGGGFVIYNILNEQLEPISEDPSFRLRSFILASDGPQSPVYTENKPHVSGGIISVHGFHNYIIHPGVSSHRVYFRYKGETMILDLRDIINSNGGGIRDRIDTVVFIKGYFRFVRDPRIAGTEFVNNDEYNNALEFLKRGLTPATREVITEKGWLTYSTAVDTSFLLENKLPAFFFLDRAYQKKQNRQYDQALTDVFKARRKPMTDQEKEYAFTILGEIYTITGKIEKAIEAITAANQLTSKLYHRLGYYEERIRLYTEQGALEKALADYDTLVAISKDVYSRGSFALFNRAKFRIDYLQQYEKAIKELRDILSNLPFSDGHYDSYYNKSHAEPYLFLLGLAEYRNKQVADAFQHWLEAADVVALQYGGFSVNQAHCDSIIQKYPAEPSTYLRRSISHRQHYYNYNNNRSTLDTVFVQKSLDDLSKAEQLGYTGYHLPFYRAACFMEIKNYSNALQQINEAISKNQSDSRLFWLRYQARMGLGLVDAKSQYTDPDVLMSQKLSQKERGN